VGVYFLRGRYDTTATSDFRLMPGLPAHCAGDIKALCADEHALKGPNGEGQPGVVLECLAEHSKEVRATSG
jgi:hypothetical protein